jgi:hypothetical protein
MAGDGTTWVGSWDQGVLGRFFAAYVANARGTPTWYPYRYSQLEQQAAAALAAYDAGEPYPFLLGEQARWFLDYLKRNGA